LEEIAKQLRWTLQIAAGETTEQIMKRDDQGEQDENKKPIHIEVSLMK
jgi:hypothetical protein